MTMLSFALILLPPQVLLGSKALEITLESSIVSGLAHEHQEPLTGLLATLFGDAGVAEALASNLIHLTVLLANEAPDTLGAAQRAVFSIVAALKTGAVESSGGGESDAVSQWLGRIQSADKSLSQQLNQLNKLSVTGGAITR